LRQQALEHFHCQNEYDTIVRDTLRAHAVRRIFSGKFIMNATGAQPGKHLGHFIWWVKQLKSAEFNEWVLRTASDELQAQTQQLFVQWQTEGRPTPTEHAR